MVWSGDEGGAVWREKEREGVLKVLIATTAAAVVVVEVVGLGVGVEVV
jgi:hypothetical protein